MKRSGTAVLALILVIRGIGPASAEEKVIKLPSRGILRKSIDKDGKAAGDLAKQGLKNVTSLTYKVLLREKGQDRFVDETKHKFEIGQQFRLLVEVESEVYLYVLHEGPKRKRTLLLPDSQFEDKAPKVKKGSRNILPNDGTCFEFVAPPGTEQLLVLACPERHDLKELETKWDELFAKAQKLRSRGVFSYGSASTSEGKTIVVGSTDANIRPELYVRITLNSK